MAGSLPDALALLEANRPTGVFAVNADLSEERGLVLARAARAIDPKLAIIYASRLPQRVPEHERVTGVPCLRVRHLPHQLAIVIRLLAGRLASDDEAQVAEEPLAPSRYPVQAHKGVALIQPQGNNPVRFRRVRAGFLLLPGAPT